MVGPPRRTLVVVLLLLALAVSGCTTAPATSAPPTPVTPANEATATHLPATATGLTHVPGAAGTTPKVPAKKDTSWIASDETCRPSLGPSHHAPLVSGYVGEPRVVAARIATALGDSLVDPASAGEPRSGNLYWDTTRPGRLNVYVSDGNVTGFGYGADRNWPGGGEAGMAEVRAVAARIGGPGVTFAWTQRNQTGEGWNETELQFNQVLEGARVSPAGGHARSGTFQGKPYTDFGFGKLVDLRDARVLVGWDAAKAAAKAYATCRLAANQSALASLSEPRTLPGGGGGTGAPPYAFTIREDSLAYPMYMTFGTPCNGGGEIGASIDTETAAVVLAYVITECPSLPMTTGGGPV